METAYWSWSGLEFEIFSKDDELPSFGGLYIFCSFDSDLWFLKKTWRPLYVGETQSIADRVSPNHKHWKEAVQHRLSHIHVHPEPQKNRRLDLEKQLIRDLQPKMNEKHRYVSHP